MTGGGFEVVLLDVRFWGLLIKAHEKRGKRGGSAGQMGVGAKYSKNQEKGR